MKRSGKLGLAALLVATHLAVFLAAHGTGSPQAREAKLSTAQIQDGKSTQRSGSGKSHARLWEKLLETDLSREDFAKTRRKLLEDWAQRDLRGVLELLYGPEASPTLNRFFPTEDFYDDIARQPNEVLEWIRKGDFGSNRYKMYFAWAEALQRNGQGELVLATLDGATPYERRQIVRSLAHDASLAELRGVRAELAAWGLDDREYDSTAIIYAQRLATMGGDNPAEFLKGEEDLTIRKKVVEAWANLRMGFPPRVNKLGELQRLPDDLRSSAVGAALERLTGDGVEKATQAYQEINRLGMWDGAIADRCDGAVWNFAQHTGEKGDFLAALGGINDAAAREKMLAAAGKGFAQGEQSDGAVGMVMEALPQGADRDACLAGIVGALWKKNPDAARQGWDNVGNEALRERLLTEMPGLGE